MPNKTLSCAVLLFCLALNAASAQNLKPFTALRVIRTERFDIIFPEESRRTAETLASFADAAYERIALLLDSSLDGRIPVTITPHTDAFNGYMSPFPYPHIVLFDTPMDIEWTTFRRSLEGLFVHELTHAISLTVRGPFFDFLHGIFGGWVLPAGLTAPLFMVEGVTVSFESLDGFGRANDPLVRERIAQAVHEGTFLSPFQASGVYDKPPLGRSYYEYGGLFSAYIQGRFGMEKYAEFWKRLGTRIPLTLIFDVRFFSRSFSDVYGVDFLETWTDFSTSLAVEGLEENEAGRIVGGESLIESVAAGGGRVFTLDRTALAVNAFDTTSGESNRVIRTDAAASDIAVSADGRLLIVSGYRYEGELAVAVAREYETASGKPTGRNWTGVYKPRYFRDGIVALESDLHDNRLIYRNGSGVDRVLLEGGEELVFSAPAPIDENRIAFIASLGGVRRIGIYDFKTGAASLFTSGLNDDEERWRYARDLRASDGRLFFSYDHDGRFYKLAVIDFGAAEEPTAFFASRDFSGGVFAPVAMGDAVFYRGAFSTWDALMRYPEKIDELSGIRTALRLEPWADAGSALRIVAVGPAFPERGYSPLRYMKPFDFWIPLPLLRWDEGTFRIDGAGAFFYQSTPTDMNTFLLNTGGDVVAGMGYFDLTWTSLGFGFPLIAKTSDKIEFTSGDGFDSPYRATRASGQVIFNRGLPTAVFGGERLRLSLAPSFEAAWIAPEDDGSAYGWSYLDAEYAAGIAAGLSTFERLPWRLFGRGFSTVARYRRALPTGEARFEGVFGAAAEPALPFRATLYGAWDEGGQDLDGDTRRYGDASFAAAAASEYAGDIEGDLRWVAGGEVELRLFTSELQRRFSYLYFNRIFGVVAWRGAAYDAGGNADLPGTELGNEVKLVQSILLKAGSVVSLLPAGMIPLRYSPFFWAALKLSDFGDDALDNFAFGFMLSVEW